MFLLLWTHLYNTITSAQLLLPQRTEQFLQPEKPFTLPPTRAICEAESHRQNNLLNSSGEKTNGGSSARTTCLRVLWGAPADVGAILKDLLRKLTSRKLTGSEVLAAYLKDSPIPKDVDSSCDEWWVKGHLTITEGSSFTLGLQRECEKIKVKDFKLTIPKATQLISYWDWTEVLFGLP